MPDIPFPTSSNPGAAPGEGAGRVINCYAFKDAGAPRWKPVPGLDIFAGVPAGDIRGIFYALGTITAVVGTAVLQVDGNGDVTVYEERLPGDGPVTIARNDKYPTPDIVIVSSAGAFVLVNNVVKSYPDGDLPVVNSVAILDGFFLWTTSGGTIWASGLNDTTVDALSNARAEARPDGLLRGVVYGQQFFAMGAETIEVWQDAGALPFPLSRVSVIPVGLFGPWAVAGQEDGWGGPLIFVAQDGSVRSLDGYTPTRISSEDLERLISRVTDPTTLRAAVYTFGGNSIWSLSSPDWTWEYNVTTGLWHERASYEQKRWRGSISCKAFGKWVIADASGATLYGLNPDTKKEGADPLIWGLDSGPVKQFPQRIQVPGAAFDFVLGQGAIGTSPQVMLSWSHDGGGKWANPVNRSLGRQGERNGRVTIYRVGLSTSAGVRWRFRISDPAYSSFCGGRMDAVGRG